MINTKEVRDIARLSNLELDEVDICKFTEQLKVILEDINKLEEIEIDNHSKSIYNCPVKNIFRKDEVKFSLDREKVLANAPEKKNGQFKVPKIINE